MGDYYIFLPVPGGIVLEPLILGSLDLQSVTTSAGHKYLNFVTKFLGNTLHTVKDKYCQFLSYESTFQKWASVAQCVNILTLE